MAEDLLINHKRFKTAHKITATKYQKYNSFFNDYAKRKYTLIDNDCLCGAKNDQLISHFDRYSVEFQTVICKDCGLVRASKYFNKENVNDFYKNHYRNIMNHGAGYLNPRDFFERQKLESSGKYELIKKESNMKLEGLKVLDLGGGAGGALDSFKNLNEVYLADFFEPYLKLARIKGIKVIKGGLKEISFKADIVIICHVLEHWNDFENEIERLISIQKKNKTINYIEFPGIDSLKLGRRDGDFFNDIHIPHVYYFTSYVFENLMNRYGFEKVYIDSEIRAIFIYTGIKKGLKNYYNQVKDDLIKAESKRKKLAIRKIVKAFIPNKVLALRQNIIKNYF